MNDDAGQVTFTWAFPGTKATDLDRLKDTLTGWASTLRKTTLGTLPRIAIGRDTSPMAKTIEAVVGTILIDNGCQPTPYTDPVPEDAVVYAMNARSLDGGLYITVDKGLLTIRFKNEEGQPALHKDIYPPDPSPPEHTGKVAALMKPQDYMQFMARVAKGYGPWLKQPREFKIISDVTNGVGKTAFMGALNAIGTPPNITYLAGRVTTGLTTEERIELVSRDVKERGADIGLVWDDAGRSVNVIDDKGGHVHPAHVAALLTASTSARWPGAGALTDHRMALASLWVAQNSHCPFHTTLTGHQHIKAQMRATSAAFGSDPDALYYFRELGWHESGVLAAILITHIAYLNEKGLASVLTNIRANSHARGPEVIPVHLPPASVVDSVADALIGEDGLEFVSSERGENQSLVMRSCLAAHDWRVVVTPHLDSIDICGEAYGEQATRDLLDNVMEAIRSGVEVAELGGEVE